MPVSLRKRAIPVVHGHNMEQVEYCVKSYADLDVQQIGFGSFGTGGKGNGVNTLNTHALSSLSLLSSWLTQHKIRVHAFGVGTPPVIYLLNKAGVFSFDSVGWMKTAGYGKIYMPFVRAYNVTYRDPTARGMTRAVFEDIKARTGHECYFCRSFSRLSEERDMRMMHNLTVILDTLEQLDQTKTVDKLLEAHSPRYAKLNQEFENVT
jgi:queuine/archaeosine tRNA-ribosyltransferase